MKVFFDTNVILDLLEDRKPFAAEVTKIFENLELENIFVSALSAHICMYLLRPKPGSKKWEHLQNFFGQINIVPVTGETVTFSFEMNVNDFEDSLQYLGATTFCDTIVTRNTSDFERLKATIPASVKIETPADFLKRA